FLEEALFSSPSPFLLPYKKRISAFALRLPMCSSPGTCSARCTLFSTGKRSSVFSIRLRKTRQRRAKDAWHFCSTTTDGLLPPLLCCDSAACCSALPLRPGNLRNTLRTTS